MTPSDDDARRPGWPLATLAAALAGAVAVSALGVPAAALVGAALGTTALAAAGRAQALPAPLRDLAFAAIGVTLGSAIGPDTLSHLARWPASIAVQLGVITTTIAVGAALLAPLARLERGAAVLAVAPGGLSVALALSEASGRDTRSVMLLQAIRLLAVTVVLPPALGLGDGAAGPTPVTGPAMGWALAGALLAAAWLAGGALARLGLPAGHLLAGIAASGALHAAGVAEGPLPPLLAFAAFTIAGAVIGVRFDGVRLRDLRILVPPALLAVAVSTGIAALAAAAVARSLDLPFGQVLVAYVPGGVEAMAAVAFSLGYDPIYVGAHHIVRLLVLVAALPWIMHRLGPPPP